MMMDVLADSLMKRLPGLVHCSTLSIGAEEVVIHAPGFEDRTKAIIDVAQPAKGSSAILLDYRPDSLETPNRLNEIRNDLGLLGVSVVQDDIIVYDRFNPVDYEENLRARLVARDARAVVVDVSTMSKLAILLTLNVCCGLNLRVRIFYATAVEYRPSREEFEIARNDNTIHRPTLQVYSGVHGVVRVDSLASVSMQGQPTAALVFMSFNDALTQVLLNTVYPSRLFLINGRPPELGWREAATAWIHDQVRREWEDDNPVLPTQEYGTPLPQLVVSTFDYRETVVLLLNLYWKLSADHRILLAPAGSKMQAVGSFLVKALHPDIHIEYPSPEGFVPAYSSGIAERWILDFGILADLLAAIANQERREYLEIPV